MGGIKDMLSPPMSKHGGGDTSPQDLRPCIQVRKNQNSLPKLQILHTSMVYITNGERTMLLTTENTM